MPGDIPKIPIRIDPLEMAPAISCSRASSTTVPDRLEHPGNFFEKERVILNEFRQVPDGDVLERTVGKRQSMPVCDSVVPVH